MGASKYDYIGIFEQHGVEFKFTASSLRQLARKMGVSYPTIHNLHKNNGVVDPKQRLPIKVFQYPKGEIDIGDSDKTLHIKNSDNTDIKISH